MYSGVLRYTRRYGDESNGMCADGGSPWLPASFPHLFRPYVLSIDIYRQVLKVRYLGTRVKKERASIFNPGNERPSICGRFALWTGTAMSNPSLPPEIHDYIVDFLHDNQEALRKCCLVSKSWIPRTRKHLFAHIRFHTPWVLQSWKKTFPDPFNSPAYYTHTLAYSQLVVDAKAVDWIDWITAFSRVVHWEIDGHGTPVAWLPTSFTPIHGFSPVIKSLRVDFPILPASGIFNLILSFPLLEDLSVITYFGELTEDGDGSCGLPTAVQLPNSPTFTGSLFLSMSGGMGPVSSRLLSLPGGIHFRKLTLRWFHEADGPLIAALVRECSDALESLKIDLTTSCTSIPHLCTLQ